MAGRGIVFETVPPIASACKIADNTASAYISFTGVATHLKKIKNYVTNLLFKMSNH